MYLIIFINTISWSSIDIYYVKLDSWIMIHKTLRNVINRINEVSYIGNKLAITIIIIIN